MSYRRLPNTDLARIRSLKTAMTNCVERGMFNCVIPVETYNNVKLFLPKLEAAQKIYEENRNNYIAKVNNPDYLNNGRLLRLYLSHFIQVFLFSVVRGEIPRKYKSYYGLQQEGDRLPDLTPDGNLVEWGKKIIEGEHRRVSEGGAPIYNPNIARVIVWFDKFEEEYRSVSMLKSRVDALLNDVAKMRPYADELILEVWNGVEKHFAALERSEKVEQCSKYGVIYYTRKDRPAK